MLDNLTERLARVVKTLRGEARLTEDNIQTTLREVRLALLEADVALPVVKDFVAAVRDKALGQEVLASLTPGQALIGVVQRELAALMGGVAAPLNLATAPPAVILLAGLQGAGKTTTAAKLARLLRNDSRKKVLLVSCDVYRPAAMEQLSTLAKELRHRLLSGHGGGPDRCRSRSARSTGRASTITTCSSSIPPDGSRIDAAMMQEIAELHAALHPVETLFVVDAMQGQDAVNTAKAFAATLPLTGIVLTKLDGDARGGAALSVCQATGAPIKYAGVAEKLEGLEVFHPERMASRILGMGDVLTLIEDAHRQIDRDEAARVASKVRSGKRFDLDDFKAQLGQMRKMGGMQGLLDKLPGELARAAQAAQTDDRQVRRLEGIINSMTPAERTHPELLKASRKRRIAAGAGVSVQEVNRLLAQFEQAQKMMKMVAKGGMQKMLRGVRRGFPGLH